MQKRAAQSGDARNDAVEMVATAAARNDPGIDVVGVELRRMRWSYRRRVSARPT
jgi:hypothetical protein